MSLPLPGDSASVKERLESLFSFLRAFEDLRSPVIKDVAHYPITHWFHDLPAHPTIERIYQETMVEQPGSTGETIILRITRPTLTPCPQPPEIIQSWLLPDWHDIEKSPLTQTQVGTEEMTERFEDDEERVRAFHAWNETRVAWQEQERPAMAAMKVFQDCYALYGLLEREGERVELLVGDGILSYPSTNESVHHPILLARVELEFFPGKRDPQFIVRTREQLPELAVDVLHALPDTNLSQLNACVRELALGEYDPLARGETDGFLRRVIQGLFPQDGKLFDEAAQHPHDIALTRDPVLFVRPRKIGLHQRMEAALEDVGHRLTTGEPFPDALMQLLNMESASTPLASDDSDALPFDLHEAEQDVLFSRPANPEQIQIATRLRHAGGVIVQGPPGTGKTHTIANLIGHLLAQGKRILVTAQTPKALRVLREKIVPSLQPLCVSVLHKDRQNQDELQQAVRGIHQRLGEDLGQLLREADALREERDNLLKQRDTLTHQILRAREDETREIVVSGQSFRPTEAASIIEAGQGADDWIPGPLNPGEPLPLSTADLAALYHMHAQISPEDESELQQKRPSLESLPPPDAFAAHVQAWVDLQGTDRALGAEYWTPTSLSSREETKKVVEAASFAMQFLRETTSWQREAIQAGRDGEPAQHVWTSLINVIEVAWREIQESKALVIEYGPTIQDSRPLADILPLLDEAISHLASGHTLGWTTRLTKRTLHSLAETLRINDRALAIDRIEEWKAVRASVRILLHRQTLRTRWQRQMVPGGSPSVEDLGEQPEQTCRQFIDTIHTSLHWHKTVWLPLEQAFTKIGFDWPRYLQSIEPGIGEYAALERLQNALLGQLQPILEARVRFLEQEQLIKRFAAWHASFTTIGNTNSCLIREAMTAIETRDPELYRTVYHTLSRLQDLERLYTKRQDLLALLRYAAPAWASALEHRVPQHAGSSLPGDPDTAWRWRQLFEELERRASTSLEHLQTSLETIQTDLLTVTAALIEKQTWAHQIQHVSAEQRKALGAYSTLRNKLTKSGQGKREAEIRSAIRREMETAKHAVPVWIMPLNEVIETFDPRSTRFDVVIIDEASQCDALALFPLYLGRQCIIVGDDEQVTPLSVGLDTEEVRRLAQAYLGRIPHKELYDGETSIYEFARIGFGHVVRLVEHFRCAPDIIAFSNALCYQGEVRPLREELSILLKPSCVPYRVVSQGTDRNGINLTEAQAITSLICAAIEQPEYQQNHQGQTTTFGVACLVGEQQASKIQALLHAKIAPDLYEQRRILCGTPAHFQGDERDVMFLSMVDAPSQGPLPLRDPEAQKRVFKKRYNVATSRARDQLWLVHSLNPETDLKPQDIRRRLIEHMDDPHAWQRMLERTLPKTESVFEERVLQHLLARGYQVTPQLFVGAFRIDLVVQGDGQRLAVECDGDAWHTSEQLAEDMARQAILERLGWRFVRIRGSVFFRDPERALQPVYERLGALGIQPGSLTTSVPHSPASELVERVSRRAAALRHEWGWENLLA